MCATRQVSFYCLPARRRKRSRHPLYRQSARKHGDNEALGWRPRKDGSAQAYEWMTYAEARARVGAAGAAFKQKGITQSGAVGIYASNSPEWMLAMKGVDFCGAKCVPLYDTFGPDAVHFIIEHSGLSVICASSDKLEDLSKALKGLDGQVKQVIVWAGPSGGSAEEACNSVRRAEPLSARPSCPPERTFTPACSRHCQQGHVAAIAMHSKRRQ